MNELDEKLKEALKWAKTLPPMTEEQKLEQSIDWVFGNLAASSNHKIPREAIAALVWKNAWLQQRQALDEKEARKEIDVVKLVEDTRDLLLECHDKTSMLPGCGVPTCAGCKRNKEFREGITKQIEKLDNFLNPVEGL